MQQLSTVMAKARSSAYSSKHTFQTAMQTLVSYEAQLNRNAHLFVLNACRYSAPDMGVTGKVFWVSASHNSVGNPKNTAR